MDCSFLNNSIHTVETPLLQFKTSQAIMIPPEMRPLQIFEFPTVTLFASKFILSNLFHLFFSVILEALSCATTKIPARRTADTSLTCPVSLESDPHQRLALLITSLPLKRKRRSICSRQLTSTSKISGWRNCVNTVDKVRK